METIEKLKVINKKHKQMSADIKPQLTGYLKTMNLDVIESSDKLKSLLAYRNLELKKSELFDCIYIDNELLFMGPAQIIEQMVNRLDYFIDKINSGIYVETVDSMDEEVDSIDYQEILNKEVELFNSLLYYIKEDFILLEDDVPVEVLVKLLDIIESELNMGMEL